MKGVSFGRLFKVAGANIFGLEFLRLFKHFLGNIISGVDDMYDNKFIW